MINSKISELIKSLSEISMDEKMKEIGQLKDLERKISEQVRQIEYSIKQREEKYLTDLLKETYHIEPQYYLDEDEEERMLGSCIFSSKEQAEDLVSRISKRSWQYLHKVNWSGPGKYVIRVEENYRCGDTEFTSIYDREDI